MSSSELQVKTYSQFNSTSFISLLIYYISFVLRAMANFYKGAMLRLKAFSALGLF
jgi:hypothetical protein